MSTEGSWVLLSDDYGTICTPQLCEGRTFVPFDTRCERRLCVWCSEFHSPMTRSSMCLCLCRTDFFILPGAHWVLPWTGLSYCVFWWSLYLRVNVLCQINRRKWKGNEIWPLAPQGRRSRSDECEWWSLGPQDRYLCMSEERTVFPHASKNSFLLHLFTWNFVETGLRQSPSNILMLRWISQSRLKVLYILLKANIQSFALLDWSAPSEEVAGRRNYQCQNHNLHPKPNRRSHQSHKKKRVCDGKSHCSRGMNRMN